MLLRQSRNRHVKQGVFGSLLLLMSGVASAGDSQGLSIADQITVSGVSSGGYMANQFHIAHSAKVSGAGIIAAGPYFCSEGNLMVALEQCLSNGSALANKILTSPISDLSESAKIDSSENLKSDYVWLLHGTLDTRVGASVTDALAKQYQALIPENQITYVNDKAFNHSLPTKDFGTDCQESKSPFISNCDFDAAGEMLTRLYPNTKVNLKNETSGTVKTIQQPTAVDGNATGLADVGYLYVPEQCENGTVCELHISFHGCQQNVGSIGMDYVQNGGFNPWADKLDLVVLYPQVASGNPVNPMSCWDWWGYTSSEYHTQNGLQIRAINQMVESLKKNQFAQTETDKS